ncbi:hypothetical protein ACFLRN_08970 [Thermoproteota archaeon]
MSSSIVQTSRTIVILPWLAGELEKEIPDLDIHGSERKLLDFAYQDLETCLIEKLNDKNSSDIEEALKDESRQDEIQTFLKIWTKKWLEKWRERVTLCQKIPYFSLEQLKAKKKAKKIFKRIKKGPELKKMIIKRLINKGEICMVDLIAENLIIEEIAFRLRMNSRKIPADKIILDPWHILQAVSPRIKRLVKRKTPLVHLQLLTDS